MNPPPIVQAGLNTNSDRGSLHAPYFSSLKLRNVRCFGEPAQKLDLSDGHGKPARWTILLGENGTGKTTILQALVALQPAPRGNNTSVPSHAQIKHGLEWLTNRNIYNLCRTSAADASRIEAVIRDGPIWEVDSPPRPMEYRRKVDFSTRTPLIFTFIDSQGHVIELDDCCFPRCYAYGAARRSGAASLGEPEETDDVESLFEEGSGLINAGEWLLRLDYFASKADESRRRPTQRRDQVKALLINVLPGIEDIEFRIHGDVMPWASVEFKTPFGWVSMNGLGFGYRTLIAWMVDLVARLVKRYPDSDNPLAEPAVVLVDEIDLHLHPTWQRKLIGDLTRLFPNTQFIVTAHSPLIVQAAGEDANIALLRREGDQVVIENDLDYIKGWRVDQILTSDLFGLPTARPPEYDAILAEQKKLLSKPKLTKNDQKRLKEIEAKVDALPYGESSTQVRKMMDLIEETQRLLRKPSGRQKA